MADEVRYSTNLSGKVVGASGAIAKGSPMVYDTAAGTWVLSTLANRTTANARTQAFAVDAFGGSALVGSVSYIQAGMLPASLSGLGTGTSGQLVRVKDDAALERVASYTTGDDIIGYAEADGRVHLHLGIPWDKIVVTASITDALVTHTNTATGGVLRTLQSWIGERWVSVKDFGAKGDNFTDDAPAFQAAIDAVYAAGGGTVYVPRALYVLGQIRMKKKVRLLGEGWGGYLKRKNGLNASLIVLDTADTDWVVIESVRIFGNATNNTVGSGIDFDNTGGSGGFFHSSSYHVLRDVISESFNDAGYRLFNNLGMTIDNCHAKNNPGYGFWLNTTDSFFTSCVAATNGKHGFKIDAGGDNRFVQCKAFTCGTALVTAGDEGDGFANIHAGRNQYIGCAAQDNARFGFLALGVECRGTVFDSCVADGNATNAVSQFSGFKLDGCTGVQGIACVADNIRGTQDYGLILSNTPYGNRFDLVSQAQNLGDFVDTTGAFFLNDITINNLAKPLALLSATDDFTTGNATSGSIGALGWTFGGGTAVMQAPEANHPGILRRYTAASINSLAYTCLRSAATDGVLLASDGFMLEYVFRLISNDTDTVLRVGLSSDLSTDAPTDAIYLEKKAADTQWFGCVRSSSSESRTAALATADTNWHRIQIRRVNSTTVAFSLDGGTEVTIATNVPGAVAVNVGTQLTTLAATTKTLDVDYARLRARSSR